ncbi:hypothetical protein [Streptomyces globisporus]|uniref:hypothetical protein n=1 Tax=Streptomyces globisporus TaxID=1908 RepID=UPI0037A24F9B
MTDTPMTPDRLAEIRNRNLNEVTSGPWLLADDENGRPLVYAERVGGHGRTLALPLFLAGAATEADAQFVASARQAVPELLAEVDRLRVQVAELEARPSVGYAVWCVEQSLGDEAAQHLLDLNPDLKGTP